MYSGRIASVEVARYLSDLEEGYEHTHWSELDLLQYYRLALAMVATWNKKDFAVKTAVEVVGGAVQTLPPPCQGVADTVYTDANGRLLPAKSVGSMTKNVPLRCKGAKAYSPTGVAIDPNNTNAVYVDPPVPEGETATIYVNCFVAPKPASLDEELNIPVHLEPLIFELMLYYAWGVDTESAPSRERSALHWQNAVFITNSIAGVAPQRRTARG